MLGEASEHARVLETEEVNSVVRNYAHLQSCPQAQEEWWGGAVALDHFTEGFCQFLSKLRGSQASLEHRWRAWVVNTQNSHQQGSHWFSVVVDDNDGADRAMSSRAHAKRLKHDDQQDTERASKSVVASHASMSSSGVAVTTISGSGAAESAAEVYAQEGHAAAHVEDNSQTRDTCTRASSLQHRFRTQDAQEFSAPVAPLSQEEQTNELT